MSSLGRTEICLCLGAPQGLRIHGHLHADSPREASSVVLLNVVASTDTSRLSDVRDGSPI